MALNTCKMWSNGVKTAFFFKKLRKIAQQLGASPPDPFNDTFELQYVSLLNNRSPNLDIPTV